MKTLMNMFTNVKLYDVELLFEKDSEKFINAVSEISRWVNTRNVADNAEVNRLSYVGENWNGSLYAVELVLTKTSIERMENGKVFGAVAMSSSI